MSKYISIDWLVKTYFVEDVDYYGKYVREDLLSEDTPTIDIVLCQDCKYWVYNFNGCSRNPCTEPWYATDFCNYGERKE